MAKKTSAEVPSGSGHSATGRPITVEVKVRLQAIAIQESDGGFSVVIPALPGCVTEADTIEEAQTNVIEAAELWLDVAHDRNKEERVRGMVE